MIDGASTPPRVRQPLPHAHNGISSIYTPVQTAESQLPHLSSTPADPVRTMSRPSASLSTVKGFSLTFNDFAAFKDLLYSPPATPKNAPSVNTGRRSSHTRTTSAFLLPESQPRRGHRHTASTSSMSSASSSGSSRSWDSPSSSDTARPRRLTERERAALANYTQPEMDITDMAAAYRGPISFEPLQ
ncbi:hypothetical protein FRC08_007708 [Ceratobasidium sp. 394]|nr:hypothetical protein FRC08_007708 [Ceratobasidium sp. 394]KAG9098889.1 hypothetical protein FS749_002666 [Ceratobasidium sp. UAMH 11750]